MHLTILEMWDIKLGSLLLYCTFVVYSSNLYLLSVVSFSSVHQLCHVASHT